MIDKYHIFEVCGNDKEGWHIAWRDVDGRRAFWEFIGSKNKVRYWKRRELAERHAQRLREGLSKITTA